MSSEKSNKSINKMDDCEFQIFISALRIKYMCVDRETCSGCIFEDNNECKITMKGIPAAWEV